MAIDRDEAVQRATEVLATWNAGLTPDRLRDPRATEHDPDDEWVVHEVQEHARAWVVVHATRRWMRTRSFLDATVGASPIVVDKATGETHVYGSADPTAYEAWLDEAP